ncbi:hypothetical protein [Methylocystis sp. SC2]|uniref:hypothetical protein n=1 Tax=Methylocystis sp. (strain SC2) TaxID=187303 RepID=UPI00130E810B|nr:hypothetical protein [Methylocystis sp. SC2]
MSARGDSRNAGGLQQYRDEKNEPNEHGLPPTIAYGARIIGAKLARGNTETPYATRAWRNDQGLIRRVDKRQASASLLHCVEPPQDLHYGQKIGASAAAPSVAPPLGAMSERMAASRPSFKRQSAIAKTKCGCSATVRNIAKIGR